MKRLKYNQFLLTIKEILVGETVYISNITITVKNLQNGSYWYDAFSGPVKIAYGVVTTFSFNTLTKTFTGTNIKLTGVSSVQYAA